MHSIFGLVSLEHKEDRVEQFESLILKCKLISALQNNSVQIFSLA